MYPTYNRLYVKKCVRVIQSLKQMIWEIREIRLAYFCALSILSFDLIEVFFSKSDFHLYTVGFKQEESIYTHIFFTTPVQCTLVIEFTGIRHIMRPFLEYLKRKT